MNDRGALGGPQAQCLAEIDCAEGNASVSFMHALSRERAQAFWRGVAQGVATGERALVVDALPRGVCVFLGAARRKTSVMQIRTSTPCMLGAGNNYPVFCGSCQCVQADAVAVQVGDVREKAHAGRQCLARQGDLAAGPLTTRARAASSEGDASR